jgi:hypothetical protein
VFPVERKVAGRRRDENWPVAENLGETKFVKDIRVLPGADCDDYIRRFDCCADLVDDNPGPEDVIRSLQVNLRSLSRVSDESLNAIKYGRVFTARGFGAEKVSEGRQ